jgi:hypothetical protein
MKVRIQVNRRYCKIGIFLSFFAALTAAAVCIVHDGVSFNSTVTAVRPNKVAEDIGNALQAQFGSTFGVNHDVTGYVAYTVKLPFGFQGGLQTMPFSKPCGQDFKQRAKEMWPNPIAVGGSGGGIGGGICGAPIGYGVVGYTPVYQSVQSCTPDGCMKQDVVVAYEPIYGPVPEQSTSC